MQQTKEELRHLILQRRSKLPKTDHSAKSKQIITRLFLLDEFQKATTILFYVSYGSEVDTHQLIQQSLSLGKTVIVPKSDTAQTSLLLSQLKTWDDLKKGAYSILEPKQSAFKPVQPDVLELILVPGIVFDMHGYRIGHGKGYYDRLLKQIRNVPCIGLAFELQIVKQIKKEEHDERIDVIITEDRIIDCNWRNNENKSLP